MIAYFIGRPAQLWTDAYAPRQRRPTVERKRPTRHHRDNMPRANDQRTAA